MVKSGNYASRYERAVSDFAIVLSNFFDDGKGELVFGIDSTARSVILGNTDLRSYAVDSYYNTGGIHS